jgi:repressor LexA
MLWPLVVPYSFAKEARNVDAQAARTVDVHPFIVRLPNRARALEVVRMPERGGEAKAVSTMNVVNLAPKAKAARGALSAANDVMEIPLHGRIAAGMPIEALEGQSSLFVPAALLGAGEHFALEVSGDSMVEAGILDGDYALIRKADVAREGEIVVALVDDSEATLKYFRREGSMVRLDPANRAYQPQRYAPNQVQVQGRLAGLLRRY